MPVRVATLIVTVLAPLSVSSTRTMVSAPSGIGAPVMMRIASPRTIGRVGTAPAAISPTTISRFGTSATSAPMTAYPSIAELRNGGTSRSATTSSASVAPSESSRSIGTASSWPTFARIRSRASSTDSERAAVRAEDELTGMFGV